MEYEILYLVGESQEENFKKIKTKVEEIIVQAQGKFLKGEWIEQRKLAYPIQHERRGTYIARRFILPNKDERNEDRKMAGKDIIGNITKKLNLQDNLLRFIIVKAEELPPLEIVDNLQEKKAARQNINTEKKADKTDVVKKEKKPDSNIQDKKESKTEEQNQETIKKEIEKPQKKHQEKEEEEKIEKKEEIKSDSENKKEENENDIDKKLEEILNI